MGASVLSREEAGRMEPQPALCAVILLFIGLTQGQLLVTDDCPVCVNVDPIPGEIPDNLAGLYKFKGESDECPGGCSYNREEDSETVYCFGPGARTAELECPATSPTNEGSSVSFTTAMAGNSSAGSTLDSSTLATTHSTTSKGSSLGSSVQLVTTAASITVELSSSISLASSTTSTFFTSTTS